MDSAPTDRGRAADRARGTGVESAEPVKDQPEGGSPASPDAGGFRSGAMGNGRPGRPAPKPAAGPKRVRGGVRLRAQETHRATQWVFDRLLRVIERAAGGAVLAEGIEYAKLGQTKRLAIEGGRVSASVQGRLSRAYVTELRMSPFTSEQRDDLVRAMSEQAIYSAKLLAGEVPPNIEDVFGPLGLKLFPSEPADIETKCNCREVKPWCKHAVCAAVLLADRLSAEPLLIFELRGIPHETFAAMLRDRRALTSQGPGPAIVYQPQIPGVSDLPAPSMEEQLDRFWEAGPELEEIDAPLRAPEVSHVLLRRLGPSPFTGPRFPLLGLLATCYELISERAASEADEAMEPEVDEVGEEEESG